MIKEENFSEAIEYARTHFVNFQSHIQEIRQAMVLLSIHPKHKLQNALYVEMTDDKNWVELE